MRRSVLKGRSWMLGVLAIASCSPGEEPPEPGETPESEPTASVEAPVRGSPDEARALLDRAVAHYQEVGREQALSDFTAPAEGFVDRDLYVFCSGSDRMISAHGADAALVGDEVDAFVDVDGFAFGSALMETALAAPEGGTVEYKWTNPVTGDVEDKVSFVQSVGDDVCGVGAYSGP